MYDAATLLLRPFFAAVLETLMTWSKPSFTAAVPEFATMAFSVTATVEFFSASLGMVSGT